VSQLLEIFGRSLPDSLWKIFREHLTAVHAAQGASEASPGSDSCQRDKRLEAGVAALESGAVGKARTHFERALALGSTDPAALIGMACVLDELAQPGRAAEHLEQARRIAPEDAKILFGLGLLCERASEPAKAKAFYLQSLYFRPQQKAARHRLMALSLGEGQYEPALRQAEALAAQFPTHLPAWARLGGLYLLTHEPDRAVRAFTEALKLVADNWHSKPDAASYYEQSGKIDAAIAALETAVADGTSYADLHVRLGDLYGKQGMAESALQEYRRALRINAYYLEATIKIAACQLKAARAVDAALWLGRAIEINELLTTLYVGLAIGRAKAGQHAESDEALHMARGIAANGPILMAQIAKIHMRLGRSGRIDGPGSDTLLHHEDPLSDEILEQAIQTHLAWLVQNEQDATAWMRLGMMFEAQGQAERAAEAYAKAVQIYPACTPAALRIVLTGALPQTPVAALERTFSPEGIDLAMHYKLATMFSQVQQFELAVESFADSLPPEQRHCFWKNLALTLEQMAMLDKPRNLWQSLCEVTGYDLTAELTGPASESSRRRETGY